MNPKVQEVLNRIELLAYPTLNNVVYNLKPEEQDYFINHLLTDIQKSIHRWNSQNRGT